MMINIIARENRLYINNVKKFTLSSLITKYHIYIYIYIYIKFVNFIIYNYFKNNGICDF